MICACTTSNGDCGEYHDDHWQGWVVMFNVGELYAIMTHRGENYDKDHDDHWQRVCIGDGCF